jgi:hypothetical protein
MSDALSSIRKRITTLMLQRLAGDDETPLPPWLGAVKMSKNRSTAIAADEMPMYSVYFVNDQPTAVGADPRRAVLVKRNLLIEARIIVKGNDDDADPHCIWVTDRMVGADQCIDQEGNKLALSVVEAETPFEPLEGTQGEVVTTKIRFLVEYTTHRKDITRTS